MSAAPDWFADKFRLAELTVRRFRHWTWSVRPVQCTLGAGVLSLNRPCEAWGEVTADENAELAAVVAAIEARVKALYAYEKINYLMLMMVDPHVHFHVVPRYPGPRTKHGVDWEDRGWPKPPDLSSGPSDPAVLETIRRELAGA
jgi:diadenosine tetraphosphate (Ap4A) HIT family hydrolase